MHLARHAVKETLTGKVCFPAVADLRVRHALKIAFVKNDPNLIAPAEHTFTRIFSRINSSHEPVGSSTANLKWECWNADEGLLYEYDVSSMCVRSTSVWSSVLLLDSYQSIRSSFCSIL